MDLNGGRDGGAGVMDGQGDGLKSMASTTHLLPCATAPASPMADVAGDGHCAGYNGAAAATVMVLVPDGGAESRADTVTPTPHPHPQRVGQSSLHAADDRDGVDNKDQHRDGEGGMIEVDGGGSGGASLSSVEVQSSATPSPPSPPAAVAPGGTRIDASRLLVRSWGSYWRGWGGQPGKAGPPIPSWRELVWSFIATFCGMAAVSAVHYNLSLVSQAAQIMLIASFGATAVLLYAAPTSPLAQPWNVVGGHILSACVGVSVRKAFVEAVCQDSCTWFAVALSVALSILVMQVTKCLHPPGGATALIAATGDATIVKLGYMFMLVPAGAGAVGLTLAALVVNNLAGSRSYPAYWW